MSREPPFADDSYLSGRSTIDPHPPSMSGTPSPQWDVAATLGGWSRAGAAPKITPFRSKTAEALASALHLRGTR